MVIFEAAACAAGAAGGGAGGGVLDQLHGKMLCIHLTGTSCVCLQ